MNGFHVKKRLKQSQELIFQIFISSPEPKKLSIIGNGIENQLHKEKGFTMNPFTPHNAEVMVVNVSKASGIEQNVRAL